MEGGHAYEIKWDDGDEGRVLAKNVRAAAASASARPAVRRPAAAPARPPKGKAGAAPRKRAKCVEGATQKANGKWSNPIMFPGREFDDYDAYRAAKKQRAARREEYSVQNIRQR